MLRIAAGVFLVLHGLVHLLYVGQSARWFELQPGMTWPDGSWMLPMLPSSGSVRLLASAAYAMAALGFLGAGVGLLAGQAWWPGIAVASAVFSTVMVLLFWDATLQRLPDQGAIAVLINVAVLLAVLVWPMPDVEF